MKWPRTLAVVRHGESQYNALKKLKAEDPLYSEFKRAYNRRKKDPDRAKQLAIELLDSGSFAVSAGDHDTPLTDEGNRQAEATGAKLSHAIEEPDVVFVSPYLRAHQTLRCFTRAWPTLSRAAIVEEERLREQEHGLALLYNDWRMFQIMHPEQEALRTKQGPYWYRYPQGENVPDVRERLRSWLGTITRDYRGKSVLAITHHLAILGLRANLERLDAVQFTHLDEQEKPVNCGVTVYRGDSEIGDEGKLLIDMYNRAL
jgi:2,3-bisphosphoglycerate-dependent phosphoglycerate mutase